jgi:RNA polymerase sigma factor (sigma-70 family)
MGKRTGGEDRYRDEYLKYPPLSREDEVEAVKNKDYDKLVKHNLRYAYKIAMWHKGCGLTLDDIIGAANLGLTKAVMRYSLGHEEGARLASYARWKIRDEIYRAVAKGGRGLSRSIALNQKSIRIKRAIEDLWKENGLKPMDYEVAERLGERLEVYTSWLDSFSPIASLDRETFNDNETKYLYDIIDGTICGPDEKLMVEAKEFHLDMLLSELPVSQEKVMARYIGFGKEPMTIPEIALEFGVDENLILSIKNKACVYIKRRWKNYLGEAYGRL